MGGSSTDYSSSRSYSFAAAPSVTRKSARDYAKDDKREYKPSTKGLPSIVGKDISTQSELVVAIMLDVTGSMRDIPRDFINKMPTLYSEANAAIQGKQLADLEKGEKLEDLLDMGIVAIGDANAGDRCPLQVLPYCHGTDLVKGVLGIFPEGGGGGGNTEESYDLGAYYLLNHSQTPNVPNGRPVLIIAGDEGFYDNVDKDTVKGLIGDDLPRDLETKKVMQKLKDKFDTFVLRPEVGGYGSSYHAVHKQWVNVFGEERVMRMDSYQRMVDCIIGICGYASGNWKTSEALLRRRQTPEQVDEVLKILHPILSAKKHKSEGRKK